jgi:hypothetical protein
MEPGAVDWIVVSVVVSERTDGVGEENADVVAVVAVIADGAGRPRDFSEGVCVSE